MIFSQYFKNIDKLLLNSFIYIGDYFKYLLLIVPVGFFINIISAQKYNIIFMLLFYLYTFSMLKVYKKYDAIRKYISGYDRQDYYTLLDSIVENKMILNTICLFGIMSFIMTFGFFIELNWTYLFLVVLGFSYIYFYFALKYDDFSTSIIVVFVWIATIEFNLFFIIYASIFLYICYVVK